MSTADLVREICALRPEVISSGTVRSVQRKINARLRRIDVAALPESEAWRIACACEYARGQAGAGVAPADAARILLR